MTGSLIKIRGVWVTDPDPDSWSPTHEPTWTTNSGRVASGKAVGSIQYRKWKIPLNWVKLPEQDAKTIQELIENGPDFFDIEFYHKCGYIKATVYASTFTPAGIVKCGNGEIHYKSATVNLIER